MYEPHYPNGPPAWPPMSNGADVSGDIRERLARIEALAPELRDRVRAHSGRLQAHDDRIQALGSRMAEAESSIKRKAVVLAKLEDLPAALKAQEMRGRMVKDALKIAGGLILLGLALAKQIPLEKVLPAVSKAFGIG